MAAARNRPIHSNLMVVLLPAGPIKMVAEFELSFAAIRPDIMGMEVADGLNIWGDEPVVYVLHKSVVVREV
eukprot:1557415-Pleurochrysis_carterae.AAC.1